MALQDRMNAFALLGAEWVLWLLVGLSLLCVAVAVERGIYLFLNKTSGALLQTAITAFMKDGNVPA